LPAKFIKVYPMNPALLGKLSFAKAAAIFRTLILINTVLVCSTRRIAAHEHIFLWKHVKVPGIYKAKVDTYVTPTAEDLVSFYTDFKTHSTFKKVLAGHAVYIQDIRVVNEQYIRGRIHKIGWVTITAFDTKKDNEVENYFTRISCGHDQRRVISMEHVGYLPPQSWLDAEGYRLRPLHWKAWSYGFSGDSGKDTVQWSIAGLFQNCPEFMTQQDPSLVIPMETSGRNLKAGIWSMFSMESYVMPGCSVLESEVPVELTLTMSINREALWSGRVMLDPENFCDAQSGSDHIFEDQVGNVFLPVRKVSQETPFNSPVVLWAMSYKCFSMQANGFHVDNGYWNRWEAHLQVSKTVFHLLPLASECAGQLLPFGC